MGLRRVTKSDIRKIARSSGATLVTSLSNLDGTEVFDPSLLGTCKKVYEKA